MNLSKKRLLALFIVGVLVGGTAAGYAIFRPSQADAPPIYWDAPEFSLIDQRGETVRTVDLRGTVWVASFIFTHCENVCPLISAEVARLRDSLAADGLLGERVRLVSFTVDPKRDTPEVLREYAAGFGGSPPSDWAFLTGSPAAEVHRMIQEGFHLTAAATPAGWSDSIAGYQVMHSPRVMLIDRAGRVRGHYPVTEEAAMRSLIEDMRTLIAAPVPSAAS